MIFHNCHEAFRLGSEKLKSYSVGYPPPHEFEAVDFCDFKKIMPLPTVQFPDNYTQERKTFATPNAVCNFIVTYQCTIWFIWKMGSKMERTIKSTAIPITRIISGSSMAVMEEMAVSTSRS